eukprot:gene4237-4800_t
MSGESLVKSSTNASNFSQQTLHRTEENRNVKYKDSLQPPSTRGKISSNKPPFYSLINELRKRFPINKRTENSKENRASQICHETGERLDPERSISTLRKQKGVSFSPQTLAVDALIENSAEDLEFSLTDGGIVDINELDDHGDSLLHRAAQEGDVDCIRVLVKHGADVNIKNKEGWPPVHLALSHSNIPAMVYLIECGANMEGYTKSRVEEFQKAKLISKQVFIEDEVFV